MVSLLTSEADSAPAPSPFYTRNQAKDTKLEAEDAKLEAADRGRVARDTTGAGAKAGEGDLYSDYYKEWILNHLG